MSTTSENKYVIGDLVKLIARFQDPVTLAYITPTDVACEVMDPAGTVTTPLLDFDAALETPDGLTAPGYFTEVDVEAPGRWYYRIEATGTGQAAQEGSFYVELSNFPTP